MSTAVDTRPRVVVDADVLGRARTGDETYWRGLLRGLVDTGSTERFDLRAATRHPQLVPAGIGALHAPARGQADRLVRRLPALLAAGAADLFHGNYFLPRGWHGPAVVTVHDISFARTRRFMPAHDLVAFRALVPRAMQRADRVLTVTSWARDDILDRYDLDPAKVVVTPNAIEDDLTPHGPAASRPPYLLLVGGLQRRKDPVTAVRALPHVDADLDLVVVGRDGGQRGAVTRAAQDLGLARRVHLLDHVDRDELVRLYRGAAALVFPSHYEGFGLPVLEAMACGTPVVAAATTSIPEVAGGAAVLVPPGDPEALGDGVNRALADVDALVDAGLRRAAGFRWTTTAQRTAAVYAEVLGG
ncbi:MAG TPA: glycosyltransferase family 1 protein [Acidimicrobiales bacterium]|nr:glycosyltransferase family 1 protein [Acidimicrobiales bacterium]